MAVYTLVVVTANELAQDDVIQLAERIGVVAFCGPGSLVQLDEDDVPSAGAAIAKRAVGPLEASARRSRDAAGVASPEASADEPTERGWDFRGDMETDQDYAVCERCGRTVDFDATPRDGDAPAISGEPICRGCEQGALVEFDGLKVAVSVENTPDGPLLRVKGTNCDLSGEMPGEYYLEAR